jgi:hypothetical protein
MKWFKHDSDAATDAKIKKLIRKHGANGYAVYFHCLELIAGDISETNITFELEHDAEIIADDLRITGDTSKSGVDIVNEIVAYIVALGLFECSANRIFCFKMLKRIDSSMLSANSKMRKLITDAKMNCEKVMTKSCISHDQVMLEETRLDYTRLEETRLDKPTRKREPKQTYGDYFNVLLSDTEYDKLVADYGLTKTLAAIKYFSEKKEMKGYKYKSDYLAMRSWAFDAIDKTEKPCDDRTWLTGGKE